MRGGSSYVPLTNPYEPPANPKSGHFSWYFQPALQLDRHNRWLAQKGLQEEIEEELQAGVERGSYADGFTADSPSRRGRLTT